MCCMRCAYHSFVEMYNSWKVLISFGDLFLLRDKLEMHNNTITEGKVVSMAGIHAWKVKIQYLKTYACFWSSII